MVRNILCLFLAPILAYQVLAINLQGLHPAVQQYILSGGGAVSSARSLPAVALKQSPPNYQSLSALASLLSSATPKPAPKPSTNLIPSNLLAALSPEPQSNSQVDAALLNNLAVALQLLLVSNLLNNPEKDTPDTPAVPVPTQHEAAVAPVTPVSVSYAHSPSYQVPASTPQATQPYYSSYEQPKASSHYYEQPAEYSPPMSMPNANFMGGSTFPNSNPFGATIPSPVPSGRGGFSLMSPYEALNPSSPYSDPILTSPFGSVMTSKKDFQSPYSAIMAADNKDLFSMSDFF